MLYALQGFVDEEDALVQRELRRAGTTARDAIKRKSKRRKGKVTKPPKHYADDWVVSTQGDARSGYETVVHNQKHYQVTHLLEHGHALRGGGRVQGDGVIAEAYRDAAEGLLDALTRGR